MESIKHDAHVQKWERVFFMVGIPPMIMMPISKGFIPIPPVWEGTEVHRMPDEPMEQHVREYAAFNNPHHVTAEQVGLGFKIWDVEELWSGTDPNVIDVEAREVKEPKQLPPPEEQ